MAALCILSGVSGAVWEVRLTTQHGFKVLWLIALIKLRVVASSACDVGRREGAIFLLM